MKIKRILAMPFALAADVVTLGKMGEGSFTQDLFDAERSEKRFEREMRVLEVSAELLKELSKQKRA